MKPERLQHIHLLHVSIIPTKHFNDTPFFPQFHQTVDVSWLPPHSSESLLVNSGKWRCWLGQIAALNLGHESKLGEQQRVRLQHCTPSQTCHEFWVRLHIFCKVLLATNSGIKKPPDMLFTINASTSYVAFWFYLKKRTSVFNNCNIIVQYFAVIFTKICCFFFKKRKNCKVSGSCRQVGRPW